MGSKPISTTPPNEMTMAMMRQRPSRSPRKMTDRSVENGGPSCSAMATGAMSSAPASAMIISVKCPAPAKTAMASTLPIWPACQRMKGSIRSQMKKNRAAMNISGGTSSIATFDTTKFAPQTTCTRRMMAMWERGNADGGEPLLLLVKSRAPARSCHRRR